ncbi:hypothetical protein [uncultured Zhongshania sp.]|uniref:hypothetical protein n=1 Tax=uncultured Zhongshania sp. TaxID=1642288 RepID=UPI0030D918BE
MATQSSAYRLPSEFIQKPAANSIRFNNRKKLPLHRLPFVGPTDEKKWGYSFWRVPKTGGYGGGCDTGTALANIYLKHLREHGASSGGALQGIVLDMFDCECNDDPEVTALRGQVVGFFSTLDHWLEGAAKCLGSSLDNADKRALLKKANNGLNFDHEAWMASLSDEDDEE